MKQPSEDMDGEMVAIFKLLEKKKISESNLDSSKFSFPFVLAVVSEIIMKIVPAHFKKKILKEITCS